MHVRVHILNSDIVTQHLLVVKESMTKLCFNQNNALLMEHFKPRLFTHCYPIRTPDQKETRHKKRKTSS